MVPFTVVFIAAVVVYLWHQRNRENEALAEYPKALFALADLRERMGDSSAAVEDLRRMGDAVFSASAKTSVWNNWSPEERNTFRKRLASASSPFLIEEAGMPPGSPRHHFTYSAVMRRMRQIRS